MKKPALLNTVLPTKTYFIYNAQGRVLSEWQADNSQQALREAKAELGPAARSAVIATKGLKHYLNSH